MKGGTSVCVCVCVCVCGGGGGGGYPIFCLNEGEKRVHMTLYRTYCIEQDLAKLFLWVLRNYDEIDPIILSGMSSTKNCFNYCN